jgi:hypothetical protein
MTSRSGRGRWERVRAAREQARQALGRGSDGGDPYAAPPKRRTTVVPPAEPVLSTPRPSESIGVLSLGEATMRLGVSRAALEAMIDAGKVETLPIEFGYMIPTREVERLLQHG